MLDLYFDYFGDGGLLLLLGLGSRLAAIPLNVAMTIAYLTADLDAVKAIFSEPALFAQAAPFPFLMTSLIVLIFGPGIVSARLLVKYLREKVASSSTDQSLSRKRVFLKMDA